MLRRCKQRLHKTLATTLVSVLAISFVALATQLPTTQPSAAKTSVDFSVSSATDSTATAAPETRLFGLARTALADDDPATGAAAAPPRTIQPGIPKPSNLPGPNTDTNPLTYFKSYMGALTRGIIGILGFLAVFFLVYGGFLYVTSAGDPEKAKKGKSIFVYAVVGLLLAAFSYAIVSTLVSAPEQIGKQLEEAAKATPTK